MNTATVAPQPQASKSEDPIVLLRRRASLIVGQVREHRDARPRHAALRGVESAADGLSYNLYLLSMSPDARDPLVRAGWCLGRLHDAAMAVSKRGPSRRAELDAVRWVRDAREMMDLLGGPLL